MLISEKLREFYYSQISNLKAMVEEIGNEDTADYEGPLLMYCWDNSYNSSNIKILFIGQETNGWNGFDRPKEKKDIDQLLKLYYDFQLGSNYNSIFYKHYLLEN